MRLICLVLLFVSLSGVAQDSIRLYRSKKTIQIAFYNVENLFDTIDDKHKLDNDFLPEGMKIWNSERYFGKQRKLGTVIDALMPGKYGPDLIGLCEVENRDVVEELSKDSALLPNNYEVIHYECNDMRGIDVAAMYNTRKIKLLHSEAISILFPEDGRIKTRDILYVKIQTLKNKDTIHVFFNHWPSRRGGEEKSEWKRIRAAETLKVKIDSLQKINIDANIIVMGDMNDYPDNKSVNEVICGGLEKKMTNLMKEYHSNGQGTYWYDGNWGVLDNIIVSESLQSHSNNKTSIYMDKGFIFKKDWLLFKNKEEVLVPAKTYGGKKYYGGYSDHLPVYLLLKL